MFQVTKECLEKLRVDPDEPHLFRSVDKIAFDNTVKNGVLWLRPDYYFRILEEEESKHRSDPHDGLISLSNLWGNHAGIIVSPSHSTSVAEQTSNLHKHYILSFHGPNADFGAIKRNFKTTHIFGVKNFSNVVHGVYQFLCAEYPEF